MNIRGANASEIRSGEVFILCEAFVNNVERISSTQIFQYLLFDFETKNFIYCNRHELIGAAQGNDSYEEERMSSVVTRNGEASGHHFPVDRYNAGSTFLGTLNRFDVPDIRLVGIASITSLSGGWSRDEFGKRKRLSSFGYESQVTPLSNKRVKVSFESKDKVMFAEGTMRPKVTFDWELDSESFMPLQVIGIQRTLETSSTSRETLHWKEYSGVYLPISVLCRTSYSTSKNKLDDFEREYVFRFDWKSVNQPIDQARFDLQLSRSAEFIHKMTDLKNFETIFKRQIDREGGVE